MLVNRTFAAAGAASGLCEGILRATSQEVLSLVHCKAAPSKPAYQHLRKPLINLVIVGDQGLDTSALAHAFAGEEQPRSSAVGGGSTQRTGFLLLQSRVPGHPASVCLWHVGGRKEAADLGPSFCSLASAFVLVYSPAHPGPAQSLSYWMAHCCRHTQDAAGPLPPLVVVASARPCRGDAAQAAAMAEAQQWCRQQGGVPHHTLDGPQDTRGARVAFAALLQSALRHHRQAAGSCGSAPTTPRGGASVREGTASLRDLMRQLDLPALKQSKLLSPLERQPRLVQSAR